MQSSWSCCLYCSKPTACTQRLQHVCLVPCRASLHCPAMPCHVLTFWRLVNCVLPGVMFRGVPAVGEVAGGAIGDRPALGVGPLPVAALFGVRKSWGLTCDAQARVRLQVRGPGMCVKSDWMGGWDWDLCLPDTSAGLARSTGMPAGRSCIHSMQDMLVRQLAYVQTMSSPSVQHTVLLPSAQP